MSDQATSHIGQMLTVVKPQQDNKDRSFIDSLGMVVQEDASLIVVRDNHERWQGYDVSKLMAAVKNAGYEVAFFRPSQRLPTRTFPADGLTAIDAARIPVKFVVATCGGS